jgi:hypothetical protein
MKIFKIQNKLSGLYFKGSTVYFPDLDSNHTEWHQWDSSGKSFVTKTGMQQSLKAILRYPETANNCKVVEFELVEVSSDPLINYLSHRQLVKALKK